jgi:glycosyltransferase involved in cell wall biosynthesis
MIAKSGVNKRKDSILVDFLKRFSIFRRLKKYIYPFSKSQVNKIVKKNNFLIERNSILIERNSILLERIKTLEGKKKLQKETLVAKQNLLKDAIIQKAALYKKLLNNYGQYNLVFSALKYAEVVATIRNQIQADIYIAHEILPIVAADMLANNTNARIVCDVVEHPRLDARAIPTKLPENVLSLIHASVDGYLRKCDNLLTVSESLGDALERYGVPVSFIPNYRYAENLKFSKQLRTMCNLKEGDELILCISIVASGFELILDAMVLLDDNIHLAVIGRLAPSEYKEKVDSLIEEKNISNRIHFFGFIPYDELTTTASGADIGINVMDPKRLNNWVSLPNRVFDYTCSGLPICSPYIPDIAKFIKHYKAGTVVTEETPEAWANSLKSALEKKDELSSNALRAAKDCTWEKIEKRLLEVVGDAEKVTFLGLKDLTKNNRTKRMARTLVQNGIKVNICCLSASEGIESESENIDYYTINPAAWK